jgi:Leucine-rich repeat (LRR) protein
MSTGTPIFKLIIVGDHTVGKTIWLGGKKLRSMKKSKVLDISNQNITSLAFTEEQVEISFLDGRKEIRKIPSNLKKLYCYKNKLTELIDLPRGLKLLNCFENQLTKLEKLPLGLEKLYCSANELKTLKELPQGLKVLKCSENQLTKLEKLPLGLKRLECYDNQLKILKGLPQGLKNLYCSGNPLCFIEPIPKRPKYCIIPGNLTFLDSEDEYSDYYKDHIIFTANFHILKSLLLLELGHLSFEIVEDVNSLYYFSLGYRF